jgi:hypothetical protein
MGGTVIAFMFAQRRTDKSVEVVRHDVEVVKDKVAAVKDEMSNGAMEEKIHHAVTVALDEHGTE